MTNESKTPEVLDEKEHVEYLFDLLRQANDRIVAVIADTCQAFPTVNLRELEISSTLTTSTKTGSTTTRLTWSSSVGNAIMLRIEAQLEV